MQRSVGSLVAFLSVVVLIVGLWHYYLWSRLVRAPELGSTWQRYGTIAVVALAVLTPIGVIASRWMPRPAQGVLSFVLYGWMGIATLLLFSLLATEVVRVGAHVWAALRGTGFDAARRQILSRGIAAAAGIAAVGLGGFGLASALGPVAVKRVRIALRKLPERARGLRIVQISDVHVGPTIGRGFLADVVARVNALEPDVVAITGDLVDGSVEALRDEIAPLADLRATHGVFFCTGNHDHYSGADAWTAELVRIGITVLRNERVSLHAGIDVAGVDDWASTRRDGSRGASLATALAGRDPDRALVLLAHQPKQIHEAAEHGVELQLSGHTHGGQIFPWNFLVGLDQPYVAGLARHGDTQIYVSRGTGYWGPPMRVGAPAEITLLELEPAA